MKNCPKCGQEVDDSAKFCPACGASLTAEETKTEETKTEEKTENKDFSAKLAALNDTANTTSDFDPKDIEDNKIMALFSYLGILFLIPLLAALRFAHGLFFGISTTASNTVAIDSLPASRRGEGIGYFGVSVNLAFATGPMTGMFLYESFGENIIFATSIILCIIGLVLVARLKVKPREKKPHAPLSLDRFFLTKAIPQFVNFIFVGFAYGPVTNYISIYAKELGIGGSGWFYALIAAGLILNRIMTGRLIDRGYLTRLVGIGMTIIVVAYLILAFCHSPFAFFASAFLIGTSLGLIFPGYQTMCVNLARHDQRGTANSTYLSGWDIGIGSGILVGGAMASHFGMHQQVFVASAVALIIADLMFWFWTSRHYIKNKLEGN